MTNQKIEFAEFVDDLIDETLDAGDAVKLLVMFRVVADERDRLKAELAACLGAVHRLVGHRYTLDVGDPRCDELTNKWVELAGRRNKETNEKFAELAAAQLHWPAPDEDSTPTKEGWYWRRASAEHKPEIVEVIQRLKPKAELVEAYMMHNVNDIGGEWVRIPRPKDGEK